MSTGSFGFGNAWHSDGMLHERETDHSGRVRRLLVIRRKLVIDSLSSGDALPEPERTAGHAVEVAVSSNCGSFTVDFPIPIAP